MKPAPILVRVFAAICGNSVDADVAAFDGLEGCGVGSFRYADAPGALMRRTVSEQINYKVFDADAVSIAERIKNSTAPNALFPNADIQYGDRAIRQAIADALSGTFVVARHRLRPTRKRT